MFKKQSELETTTQTSETIIGEGLDIKGDIIGQGTIIINGNVKGSKLKTDFKILIEKNANIDVSEISAKEIHISGKINGNINSENTYIYSSAIINGNINTKNIKIDNGSIINGNIKMSDKSKITKDTNTDTPKTDLQTAESVLERIKEENRKE